MIGRRMCGGGLDYEQSLRRGGTKGHYPKKKRRSRERKIYRNLFQPKDGTGNKGTSSPTSSELYITWGRWKVVRKKESKSFARGETSGEGVI